MESTQQNQKYFAIVVGAGASGLAAAQYLHSLGKACIVLEAQDRIGGRVWTQTGEEATHGSKGKVVSRRELVACFYFVRSFVRLLVCWFGLPILCYLLLCLFVYCVCWFVLYYFGPRNAFLLTRRPIPIRSSAVANSFTAEPSPRTCWLR
jgi:hypothetical protein